MRRQAGFTLVELVAVIVLLGIVAASSTQFILQAVGIYRDSTRRDNLTQTGRFAVERITRELRNALPGSIRVRVAADNSVQCVEFVPVVAATAYLNNIAGTAISSLDVVDFSQPVSPSYSDDQVVIFPLQGASFYAGGSQYRTGLASVSAASGGVRTLTFDSAHRFNNDSPQRRLYIVDQPVSFCASDNSLTRHQGNGGSYTYSATQPLPPSNGVLLAQYIRLQDDSSSPLDVFFYQNGTPYRNAVVTMDLRFSDAQAADESVSFNQQVVLRNTP